MGKIILSFMLLIGCTVGAVAQNGSESSVFPEDFKLRANEAPVGFELVPVDEEAKHQGIFSNPALVKVASFGPHIYPQANITVMKQILLTVYRDVKPDGMDIDIYAIEYKSAKDLEKESGKMSAGQDLKYFLKKGNYLVIVSGDLTGSYAAAVKKIADQLTQRLGLQLLAAPEKYKNAPEEEPVSVPAE